MFLNPLRQKIADGKPVIGPILQEIPDSPDLVEFLGSAGFDYVMVDGEHAGVDVKGAREMARAAESVGIECTTEAAGSATRTDADAVHISRGGVPTAVVSIPLRYMHSPVELVELGDVEAVIAVIAALALRLEADQTLTRW